MHIRPIKTQKINENIFVVRTLISNFYIYTKGQVTICFDTGYLPPIINHALKKLGVKQDDVTDIFLTHSDFDHVGGIRVFKKANIYLSSEEEKMITFKKPRILFMFNLKIRRKYELLNEGDIIEVGDIKIKAIQTPGHTIGSMSYLVNGQYLFTGDTLTLKKGEMKPFFFMQNMNTAKQKKSIEKIRKIKESENIKMICTGHSGYMEIDKE